MPSLNARPWATMVGAGSFGCKMPAVSHRSLLSPRRDTITSKPLQSSKSLAQMSQITLESDQSRIRSLANQRDHLNHINLVVQKASLFTFLLNYGHTSGSHCIQQATGCERPELSTRVHAGNI